MNDADVKEYRRLLEYAERALADMTAQRDDALAHWRSMRRQRDEAVAEFQRERERVARVEAALETIGTFHPVAADHVFRALADRPQP